MAYKPGEYNAPTDNQLHGEFKNLSDEYNQVELFEKLQGKKLLRGLGICALGALIVFTGPAIEMAVTGHRSEIWTYLQCLYPIAVGLFTLYEVNLIRNHSRNFNRLFSSSDKLKDQINARNVAAESEQKSAKDGSPPNSDWN